MCGGICQRRCRWGTAGVTRALSPYTTMLNPRPSRHVTSPPLSHPSLITSPLLSHPGPVVMSFPPPITRALLRSRLLQPDARAARAHARRRGYSALLALSLSLSRRRGYSALLAGGRLAVHGPELLVKPRKNYWSNRVRITGQTALESLVKPAGYSPGGGLRCTVQPLPS